MRVTLWVDALEPHPGGIGRYTWELCKGLTAHEAIEPLKFYGRRRMIDDPAILLRGDALPRQKNWLVRAWDRWRLNSGLFHGPNYFLPDFVDRGVITIHDLSVFRFPETHPEERLRAFEREFESSLSRAAHIITDTETIRRELIDGFSVAPERVTAIPLGVDDKFRPRPADEIAPALAGFNLAAGEYGLCVSTLEPRKKIAELLSAWRSLPAVLRDRFPLVLAGGAGWLNDALRMQVERGQSEGWLRHLGFIDESILPDLYAGAAILAYPSIYEGFGLPAAEAMASGIPVVVADRSCMPEVCGDAALFVDPDDERQFVQALERGLTDQHWRKSAIMRGLAIAGGYSWDRCIRATVDIYRQVARAT
jgi:glycosyltransferase involved in cell wall biosynthesis